MADPSALQRSELVIAKVLDLAMTHGIQEWFLSFDDLDLGEDYALHFYPCLRWLEAEGIIRVGEYSRAMGGPAVGHVSNVVLTAFGMNILGHKVQLGDETIQIADAVERVSAGQGSYSSLGDFFGGLLGGFTKSLGS